MYDQSSDSNYEIEEVLNDKIIDGKMYYFVKWKGYPHSQNSWQPEEHLINASEHVYLWKLRKNKLRKLDKVSKRKKDEESFDGKKYIKKDRPPGPIEVKQNKQMHQIYRKSLRIKQKDDTTQGQLSRDIDSQKTLLNQQSLSSSKSNDKKSKNSLFQVLSSIQKINKQRQKQKQELKRRKNILDSLQKPITMQSQAPKKKRGRKKKKQIDESKQKSKELISQKKSLPTMNNNKKQNQKKVVHRNDYLAKVGHQQKHYKQQNYQIFEMQGNKQKNKPEIYDEILHYSNDSIPRSRFHTISQKNNKNNNINNSNNNKNNNKSKRKKSMAELGDIKDGYGWQQNFNKQYQQKQGLNNYHSDKQRLQQQQQPKRPKLPLWLVDNSFRLFDQHKNSRTFDQLQQIGLSESKRMPNFLDRYGLTGYGNNSNNIQSFQANKKKISAQLINNNSSNHRKGKTVQAASPFFNHQQQPYIQPQTNCLNNKNNTNRLYKSQVSQGLYHSINKNCNNNNFNEISLSSGNSNVNNDDSLIVIRQEDYAKSVKRSRPGKKVFLNQNYKQVSINVDSVDNEITKQSLNKSTGFVPTLAQPLPPCDPRFIYRSKVAAQHLYDFLFKNPSMKRFELSPQQYIKSLVQITKNEIKKKGVCIDLQELQRREVQRNWSVDDCKEQEYEEVWVLEQGQASQQINSTNSNKNKKANILEPISFTDDQQSHNFQKNKPFNKQSIQIIQQSISSQQKETIVSQSNSKPSQQQSGDIQLLKGLQQDIEDLFRQRYPSQPITNEIKQQISKIVRKIAYENMDIEVGLGLIEEWLKKREGINGFGDEKSLIIEQKNQQYGEGNKVNNYESRGNNNMSKSRDSQQGEMIFLEDQLKSTQTQRTQCDLSAHAFKLKQLPINKINQSIPAQPLQPFRPSKTIQQSNIIKVIEQFEYKNERCFKLLLKNNQQVNVHYLQLKKNCPKVLFDYLEMKCQQFQKQFMVGNKGKMLL